MALSGVVAVCNQLKNPHCLLPFLASVGTWWKILPPVEIKAYFTVTNTQ